MRCESILGTIGRTPLDSDDPAGLHRGQAQQMPDRHAVEYERTASIDPYTLLPAWLHPR